MPKRTSRYPSPLRSTTRHLGESPDRVTTSGSRRPSRREPPTLAETARIRLSLRPGQRGTKKLLREYGDRLVCVRYRYDEQNARRLKTVELVVEAVPWSPEVRNPVGEEVVDVRVDWQEAELRDALKGVGGRWNPKKRLWEVQYDQIVALGLEDRIV